MPVAAKNPKPGSDLIRTEIARLGLAAFDSRSQIERMRAPPVVFGHFEPSLFRRPGPFWRKSEHNDLCDDGAAHSRIATARIKNASSPIFLATLFVGEDYPNAPLARPDLNGAPSRQDNCLSNRFLIILAPNDVRWRGDTTFPVDLEHAIICHVWLPNYAGAFALPVTDRA